MLNIPRFLAVVVVVLLFTGAGQAKTLNLREAPFSATGDGTADDRPALVRAFSEAKPGDTVLFPPGNYRVVLIGGALAIPDGITLWGRSGKSMFSLGPNVRVLNTGNSCGPGVA